METQGLNLFGPMDRELEMGAYEAMWDEKGASFKSIAKKFAMQNGKRPSDFTNRSTAQSYAEKAHERLKDAGKPAVKFLLNEEKNYPRGLRDAEHPIELFYYQGKISLINKDKSVAVIGTRNPSDEGVRQARELVKFLVASKFTVVSGLARGIDTTAHQTVLDERKDSNQGSTIAVLGTPLSSCYPKENEPIQKEIAKKHLLISQVPVERYYRYNNPLYNKMFFPARNATMSALTKATVIVEAGEKSGTLIQARAALKQGRQLFILNSCFTKSDLTWPEKFLALGARRVEDFEEIRNVLVSK